MKIRKAIITSAGKGQRTIPLQTFVDRDGKQKSALQILIEEATSSGVEDFYPPHSRPAERGPL